MGSLLVGDDVNKESYEGIYLLRRYRITVLLFSSPNQHFPLNSERQFYLRHVYTVSQLV